MTRLLWPHAVLALSSLLVACGGARAAGAPMYSLDLDSLAWRAEVVIEGEVVAAKRVEWSDVLTVKVSAAFGGDVKAGQSVDVWLSAYRKATKRIFFSDDDGGKFAAGDRLILFLRRVPTGSKDEAASFAPVASGVKVIVDGKVTGMSQAGNPGPYANTVGEGEAAAYREKVAASVKWAAKSREEFAAKKGDPKWLVEKLAALPPLNVAPVHLLGEDQPPVNKPPTETIGRPSVQQPRDEVASDLCEALAATKDAEAIARAKSLRMDDHERRLLEGAIPSPR